MDHVTGPKVHIRCVEACEFSFLTGAVYFMVLVRGVDFVDLSRTSVVRRIRQHMAKKLDFAVQFKA